MSLTRRALIAHRVAMTAGLAAALAVSTAPAIADDTTLLKRANEIFAPLPKDMAVSNFPITAERVHLGRLLFFDPRLSIDANVSCATCHQPALYGADALPKSIGVRQRVLARNAPSVLNLALSFVNNWRG